MTPGPDRVAGPYATERQATADTGDVRQAGDRPGGISGANYERLIAACERSGVTLGAFDRRILVWLAGWEPETCQMIIGLLSRTQSTYHAKEVRQP
jgi:hypothetical protein